MSDSPEITTSTAEMRRYFLSNYARGIVDIVCRAATGAAPLPDNVSAARLSDAWGLLSKMLESAPDRKLSVSNAEDVEDALARGDISITELATLMTALRTKSEAEILPGLDARLREAELARKK
jgi:hypothetical protein